MALNWTSLQLSDFNNGGSPMRKGTKFLIKTAGQTLYGVAAHQTATTTGIPWELWQLNSTGATFQTKLATGTATPDGRTSWYSSELGTPIALTQNAYYMIVFQHNGAGYQYSNSASVGVNNTDVDARFNGYDGSSAPSAGGTASNTTGLYNHQISLSTTGTPTGTDGSITLGLTQQMYSDSSVNLTLNQQLYADSSVNVTLIQSIYRDTETLLGLYQTIYKDTETLLPLTQAIYRDSELGLNVRQEIYAEAESVLNLIQEFYEDSQTYITLQLIQVIYRDSSTDLPMTQAIYQDSEINVPLRQEMYESKESFLALIQEFYKVESIIGVIALHGTTLTHITLKGKQPSTIHLQGTNPSTIHLKGGIQ